MIPRTVPALLLVLAACGGAGDPPPAETSSTSGESPPSERSQHVQPSEPSQSSQSSQPSRSPVSSEPSREPGPGGSWVEPPVLVEGEPGPPAILTAVRTGAHDGFDRLVLEFDGDTPGYEFRYLDEPLRQCGSGRVIEIDAPAILHIRLSQASAHDARGRATLEDRDRRPGLGTLRSARLVCDYEGYVEWLLGVSAEVPIRVRTLDGPPRLVVDLRR